MAAHLASEFEARISSALPCRTTPIGSLAALLFADVSDRKFADPI